MEKLTDVEIRELATVYVIGLLYMAKDEAGMMNLTETLDEEGSGVCVYDEEDLDQILEQARGDLQGVISRYVEEN